MSKYEGLPKCQDCGWKLGTELTNNCNCNLDNYNRVSFNRYADALAEARELQMKSNESLSRKREQSRPVGNQQSQNPYPCPGSGGNKSRSKFQKGCIGALALTIIVPLLALFTFLAMIGMIAKVIPEITEHITR